MRASASFSAEGTWILHKSDAGRRALSLRASCPSRPSRPEPIADVRRQLRRRGTKISFESMELVERVHVVRGANEPRFDSRAVRDPQRVGQDAARAPLDAFEELGVHTSHPN